MSSRISYVRDVRLGLSPGAVLARLGRAGAGAGGRWAGAAVEAVDLVNALAEPAIALTRMDVVAAEAPKVALECAEFVSFDLCARLEGCAKCTLFLLTLGEALDGAIGSLAGEPSRQLLADAAGSEAAEACARWLQRSESARARQEGCRALPRFSPGYGDFGLENQRWFVENLPGLGVSLTSGGMLVPGKSVTGVIGWKRS
ncbi:hypothetical protein GX411_00770 [Candidatus Fermentibacteria bacterium]|nr:hypothetical protein [Candidatus Fermentibacteria bacterium]